MKEPPNAPTNPATPDDAAPASAHVVRRRGPRMDRLAHVRRGLSRVYRDLSAWNPPELKPAEKIARARALGFLLAELANVMKGDDLERRLAMLEELARGGRH